MTQLNKRAEAAWAALVVAYPDWAQHFGARDGGDLEVAVPAPDGSRAGHLVVFSDNHQLWVRFSPPAMCYSVDTAEEMLAIVDHLLCERAAFVTTWRGADWTGTTVVRTGTDPVVSPGEVAVVISWTGSQDRMIPKDSAWPDW